MPIFTTKHLFSKPVNTDHARLWEHIGNLADEVDNKVAMQSLPWFGKNYITGDFGGGGITNPSGLNVAVATGRAMIQGVQFDFAASGNLLLPANSTSRIWLTATFANGRYTGHTWSTRTDVVVPADSVMVGEVVTGAAAPTLIQNTFRGVIHPGRLIQRVTSSVAATQFGANATIGSALDFCHDGVTPVEVRVDAPRTYAGATVDVAMHIRNITDASQRKALREYFAAATQLRGVHAFAVGAEMGTLLGRKLIGLASSGVQPTTLTFEQLDLTARFDF